MTAPGEVALVLHTHLPWLRGHGGWPVGEEWLFQAWGESWLPVTGVLLELAEEGQREVLTLGVTPLVAEQVADARLADDLGTWLGGQMWRSEEHRGHLGISEPVRDLSSFYWRHYAALLELHQRVQKAGGLLAVWAELASRGIIELLGGPATHPYLPLQRDEHLVTAQLEAGLAHHATWAGTRPTGLWAPEMGYRPRGQVADATAGPRKVDRHGTPTLPRQGPELPGLEELYAGAGIDHFLVDAPTLVRAAGGAERDWTERPAVPDPAGADPYEAVHDGVLVGDSDVVAFARDLSVAYHVWSPTAGYPGNAWYRDFHAVGGFGLHRSWRVTDRAVPLHEKAVYEPARAAAQVATDAGHLHSVLREVLDPRPGDLVVAAYDTELFGHWWFEGPRWLGEVLRRIARDPALRTTTLASRRSRRPPKRRLHLPESSWGYAKGHASWVTRETRPMWEGLVEAERIARRAMQGPVEDDRARQLARELALLAGSDWPFMVTRGNAADYAVERFQGHLDAVRELASGADPAPDRLRDLELLDAAPADPTPLVDALRRGWGP